jgi:hypothetical protein
MKRVSQWSATVVVVVAVGAGCGGGAKEPAAAEPEPTESPAASTAVAAADSASSSSAAPKKEPSDVEVPKTCETRGSFCLPPAGFVKKLCQEVHPDLALAFFAKGTPFTRGYMRGAQDAFNGYGGVSSGDKLVFDEEVIVLSSRENKTGIEVSGASGQVDLLRWDGSCATVPAADVNYQLPPSPKTAAFEWKVLSDEMQTALLADENIAKLNKERRNECKGASMGDVSKKCVKLVEQLRVAVVSYVRSGAGTIPAPTKLK